MSNDLTTTDSQIQPAVHQEPAGQNVQAYQPEPTDQLPSSPYYAERGTPYDEMTEKQIEALHHRMRHYDPNAEYASLKKSWGRDFDKNMAYAVLIEGAVPNYEMELLKAVYQLNNRAAVYEVLASHGRLMAWLAGVSSPEELQKWIDGFHQFDTHQKGPSIMDKYAGQDLNHRIKDIF